MYEITNLKHLKKLGGKTITKHEILFLMITCETFLFEKVDAVFCPCNMAVTKKTLPKFIGKITEESQ